MGASTSHFMEIRVPSVRELGGIFFTGEGKGCWSSVFRGGIVSKSVGLGKIDIFRYTLSRMNVSKWLTILTHR